MRSWDGKEAAQCRWRFRSLARNSLSPVPPRCSRSKQFAGSLSCLLTQPVSPAVQKAPFLCSLPSSLLLLWLISAMNTPCPALVLYPGSHQGSCPCRSGPNGYGMCKTWTLPLLSPAGFTAQRGLVMISAGPKRVLRGSFNTLRAFV